MKGYKNPKIGNDKKKIMALYGHSFKAGEFEQFICYHDDWCRFFKKKPCNCDPDIVRNPTEDKLAECFKEGHRFDAMILVNPRPEKIH